MVDAATCGQLLVATFILPERIFWRFCYNGFLFSRYHTALDDIQNVHVQEDIFLKNCTWLLTRLHSFHEWVENHSKAKKDGRNKKVEKITAQKNRK